MDVGRHIELYLLVRGAIITIHHATEVLADAESLGQCLAALTKCCGQVWWGAPSCPGSLATSYAVSVFFSLEIHQLYFLLSLYSFSFTFTIFFLLVRGAIITIHHANEVFADAESLRQCLAALTECCGQVWWGTPSCPGSPVTSYIVSVFFSLEIHQLYFLLSLYSFSFTFTIFFIQTQNFKNKRI